MSLIDTEELMKVIKDLERERKTDDIKEYMVLKQILDYTRQEPLKIKRIKVDGRKEYMPTRDYSWNGIAECYVRICKIVREFFGEKFKLEEEPHR